MDTEALVTFRLLKSGGKDFDLNVTRYTNSQNPVQDRDFCANDDIQIALQNDSYQTKVWYEKRRDEFRETPDGVRKIPNLFFANAYLAYHLQDPVSVLKNYAQRPKNLNFISHKNHKDGLYEKIFNEKTTFKDMLCSFYVFDTIVEKSKFSFNDTFKTNLYHSVALFKIAFTKYLVAKYGKDINVNNQIIKIYEKGEKEIIIKTFMFINQFIGNQIEISKDKEKNTERLIKFLFTLSHYQKIYDILVETEISVKDIENIVLKGNEEIIDGEKNNEDNEIEI